MNNHVAKLATNPTALPPVLDLRGLDEHFKIGRTTAYALASAGEIQSLTLGAPGKRGKRVFLTESVMAYVTRRLAASTPLQCGGTRGGNRS